jgi:two-component system, LytTR family, sensor kinase
MTERSTATGLAARSRLARGALLAAVLTAPAIVIATQLYVGYRLRGVPVPFGVALLTQLLHWEIWAIAGPIVWRLERRWPLDGPQRGRSLLRHFGAALIVAFGVLALYYLAYHAVVRVPGISPWFTGMDRSFGLTAAFFAISYFHLELLLYAGVVAAAHAVRATALLRAKEHESLRLEAELTGARLTALRTQLQPHFLFNTLHMIGSSVLQRHNERAVQMIAELGELLRATLAHRDTELAPLGDEVAYLERYLRIEEARFGDRLRVEWQLDPAALDRLVPPFILQPLIENAFRHGIAHRTDDSVLRISAAQLDGSLRIEIYNDGPPLGAAFDVENAGGYGVKNVVERLRTRMPPGRLEIANRGTGVAATLVLPVWDTRAT